MTLSRRTLLKTAPFIPLVDGVNVALGADQPGGNIVVSLFLRFGMDGMQLVAPADDASYRDARPYLGVQSGGLAAGYPIDPLGGVPMFIHPRAGGLRRFYEDKKLAIVHAAGVKTSSRSHFKDQDMVDKGMADFEIDPNSGWLARHMNALGVTNGDFDAVANGFGQSPSLVGYAGAVSFNDPDAIAYAVYGNYQDVIARLNVGSGPLQTSTRATLAAVDAVREKLRGPLAPNPLDDPGYTYGPLSYRLKSLARLLRFDLGVRVATVDFGGWDHHDFLVESFGRQADELARSLTAFFNDLGEVGERVTVVAFSEFGRRLAENGNGGTEHGAGGVMLVLGAGVNGGKVYGQWPGLKPSELDEGDLRVTTDYRSVLSEVLVKRHRQTHIDKVFPTVPYSPLGIIV